MAIKIEKQKKLENTLYNKQKNRNYIIAYKNTQIYIMYSMVFGKSMYNFT